MFQILNIWVYNHECYGESDGDVKNVVLVGSSLGGWLSILAARQIPERLHGMGG